MKISKVIQNVLKPPIVETAEFTRKFSNKNKSIINFGQGVPFFSPPRFVLDKLSDLLVKNDLIHKYTNDEGLHELRELILEKHSKYYPFLNQRNLIITAGANQAFFIVLQSIINSGDEIIVFTPYYFNHVMAIQSLKCVPIFVKRNESFNIDIFGLEKKITQKTKAIVITSPDNPTGSVFSKRKLKELTDIAKNRNLWIIQDETYCDFIYEETTPHNSLMGMEPDNLSNVISIHSFSKNFGMSGYRLGYMFFPAELYSNIIKLQDTLIVSPPAISQYLAKLMLEDQKEVSKWFSFQMEAIKNVRDYILVEINNSNNLEIKNNSLTGLGGYYLFPKVVHSSIGNTLDLSKKLITDQNVILLPGQYFGPDWKDYVRISFGNVSMNDAVEGLNRIHQLLVQFEKI